ncbi:regulator of microtubule dynamics protein 2 isoform X1 [Anas platyrhynchos]|uniref:regulator of microtubule dynamics protein 2 isoform X1 n=2 Tax=Anas platyrhynchos TaxID=8839 RepID=UPI003AF30C37
MQPLRAFWCLCSTRPPPLQRTPPLCLLEVAAKESAEMSRFENKGLILGIMAGTAGISLVLIWYRKVRKPGAAVRIPDFADVGNKLNSVGMQHETHNEQGAVMVLHRRQLQILEKLNDLLISVDELKREVKFLKEAIPKLEELVRDELQGKGDAQRVSPSHRAARRRKAETTPAKEATSSEEAESEGGYLTAHTDTEGDSEEEKGCKKPSDVTVQSEEEELLTLLRQVDSLHKGSEDDKKEGFRLLLEKDDKYENCVDFLWRVARAYGDMFEMTADTEEKKKYVSDGKDKAEKAVQLDANSAESHQWFAIMCGYMSQFESVQNKIRNGYLFKEHLDKAIELKPQDPFLYYLNGRWCYSVAQLSWLEKKVAAALFGTPPTSTVEEALQNFLKAEEMHPGYSKYNYVYLAKCYKDLGQKNNALKYCDSALSVLSVTNEDREAQKDLEALLLTLKL